MALRFDLREPAARYIEYRHDDDKYEIEERKAPSISGGHWRRHHRVITEEPGIDRSL